MSSGQHSQTHIPVGIEELKSDFVGTEAVVKIYAPSARLRLGRVENSKNKNLSMG